MIRLAVFIASSAMIWVNDAPSWAFWMVAALVWAGDKPEASPKPKVRVTWEDSAGRECVVEANTAKEAQGAVDIIRRHMAEDYR